jgi:hypothetical protein
MKKRDTKSICKINGSYKGLEKNRKTGKKIIEKTEL